LNPSLFEDVIALYPSLKNDTTFWVSNSVVNPRSGASSQPVLGGLTQKNDVNSFTPFKRVSSFLLAEELELYQLSQVEELRYARDPQELQEFMSRFDNEFWVTGEIKNDSYDPRFNWLNGVTGDYNALPAFLQAYSGGSSSGGAADTATFAPGTKSWGNRVLSRTHAEVVKGVVDELVMVNTGEETIMTSDFSKRLGLNGLVADEMSGLLARMKPAVGEEFLRTLIAVTLDNRSAAIDFKVPMENFKTSTLLLCFAALLVVPYHVVDTRSRNRVMNYIALYFLPMLARLQTATGGREQELGNASAVRAGF